MTGFNNFKFSPTNCYNNKDEGGVYGTIYLANNFSLARALSESFSGEPGSYASEINRTIEDYLSLPPNEKIKVIMRKSRGISYNKVRPFIFNKSKLVQDYVSQLIEHLEPVSVSNITDYPNHGYVALNKEDMQYISYSHLLRNILPLRELLTEIEYSHEDGLLDKYNLPDGVTRWDDVLLVNYGEERDEDKVNSMLADKFFPLTK